MNCPKCHTPGAYVGLSVVECRNSKCEFHHEFEDTDSSWLDTHPDMAKRFEDLIAMADKLGLKLCDPPYETLPQDVTDRIRTGFDLIKVRSK